MEKKNITIIVLSLIIIILILIIFTGRSRFETIIEQIQGQRDSLVRSTEALELENKRIDEESRILRSNNIESEENNQKLKRENTKYREIIDELTAGSEQSKKYLSEYGLINRDFAEFLQQATVED